MIDHRWELLLIGWGVAAAIQLVLYLIQRVTNDATAVDAGWAASLVAIAILDGVLGNGCVSHRVLIAVIVGLENLRLSLLVLRRVGKGEDTRYQELRRRWRERGREQLTFFVFFQAQGLLAVILSVPLLLSSFDSGSLGVLAIAGTALWVVAEIFQTVADEQLRRFKGDPANKGKTMMRGLWHYSRHPNYFFQWLTWVAYALVALEAPYGYLGLTAPALMLFLILFVTGVPPAEESSLRSRGDEYRQYQRETSMFVPWFPKS